MDSSRSYLDDEVYFFQPRAFQSEQIDEPREENLLKDRLYPQFNSQAYHYKVYTNTEEPPKFLPCYTLLDINDEGFFVVGTNSFTSPFCRGNFLGADNFDVINEGNIEKTTFQIAKDNTVSGLKFLNSNVFLAANIDNTLEVFTKQTPMNTEKSKKFYRLSELNTEGFVQNIEKLSGEKKFIVGTDEGHLSIYDYGSSDIIMTNNLSYAQDSPISGLSSHPSSQRIWTSCAGFDCLLWDKAKEKPASSLLNYESQFTAVHWTSQEENNGMVILGDEIGSIMTVDPRAPKKILNSIRCCNRPITEIFFNGSKQFGVIAGSEVKIIDAGENFKTVFEHKAKQILYSGKWDTTDKKTFYVVGDKKTSLKFTLS